MTRLERRTVLAGMGVIGLGACAPAIRIGEGKKPPKGGIGGTGIVGTLTDFGSLIVNGLRIETGAETVILDALGVTSAEALKIGQVLTVEATGTRADASGKLVARSVRISHPVIGPVQEIGTDGRQGVVAGISVVLEEGAIGQLVPGERVAVSGVWRGRRVVASRVDRLSPTGPVVIAGVLETLDRTGGRIAGVAVRAPRSRLPAAGSFVTVVGNATSSGLEAVRIVAGRFFGAAVPLERLSVEGFLEPAPDAPFFVLSGLGQGGPA